MVCVCVRADSGDDNSIKTGWWWSVSVQTLVTTTVLRQGGGGLCVCVQTLVTTTALTGKSQALQADAGESYQVELLSAAEAYTPAVDDAEVDAMELVQSQLVRA